MRVSRDWEWQRQGKGARFTCLLEMSAAERGQTLAEVTALVQQIADSVGE